MTFTIETYGLGETIVTILQGVAMITNLSQQPGMTSLLKLGLMIGLVYAVIKSITSVTRSGISPLMSLIIAVIGVSILVGIKSNVVVKDMWGAKTALIQPTVGSPNKVPAVINTVPNVPLVMGFIAQVFTSIDNFLTNIADTVFGNSPLSQISGKYTDNGFMGSLELLNKVAMIGINNQNTAHIVDTYMDGCFMPFLANSSDLGYQMAHSENLISVLDISRLPNNPDPQVIYTDPQGATSTMSCSALYAKMKTEMTKYGGSMIKELSATTGVLQSNVNRLLTGVTKNGLNAVLVAANLGLITHVANKGYMTPSGAMGQGGQQSAQLSKEFFKGAMKFSAAVGRTVIPVIKQVLVAVMLGLFPIVLLIITLPGGSIAIVSYAKTFMWLTLWGPFMVILNTIASIAQGSIITGLQNNSGAGKGLTYDPASMIGLQSLTEYNSLVMAVVGLLTISVPRLAYMLMSRGEVMANGIAESFGRPVMQTNQQLAQGNLDTADVRMNNEQALNHQVGGYSNFGSTITQNYGHSAGNSTGITSDARVDSSVDHAVGQTVGYGQGSVTTHAKQAIAGVASNHTVQKMANIMSSNDVGASMAREIRDQHGHESLVEQLSQIHSSEDFVNAVEQGKVDLKELSQATGISTHGLSTAAATAAGMALAERNGWISKGAGGAVSITEKGRAMAAASGMTGKGWSKGAIIGGLAAAGLMTRTAEAQAGFGERSNETSSAHSAQSASTRMTTGDNEADRITATKQYADTMLANAHQGVTETEGTGDHESATELKQMQDQFTTQGQLEAKDFASVSDTAHEIDTVSHGRFRNKVREEFASVTESPGMAMQTDNSMFARNLSTIRDYYKSRALVTPVNSKQYGRLLGAIHDIDGMYAEQAMGYANPTREYDQYDKQAKEMIDKVSEHQGEKQAELQDHANDLHKKAGDPGQDVKSRAQVKSKQSKIKKRAKKKFLDLGEKASSDQGAFHALFEKETGLDPSTLSQNGSSAAIGLFKKVKAEYASGNDATRQLFDKMAEGKTQEVATQIAEQVSHGNLPLAGAQHEKFVEGYAAMNLARDLRETPTMTAEQQQERMDFYRQEAVGIVDGAMQREGAQTAQSLNQDLEDIRSNAQQAFTQTYRETGDMEQALVATENVANEGATHLVDKYGDNKLLFHGKGITPEIADHQAHMMAVAGIQQLYATRIEGDDGQMHLVATELHNQRIADDGQAGRLFNAMKTGGIELLKEGAALAGMTVLSRKLGGSIAEKVNAPTQGQTAFKFANDPVKQSRFTAAAAKIMAWGGTPAGQAVSRAATPLMAADLSHAAINGAVQGYYDSGQTETIREIQKMDPDVADEMNGVLKSGVTHNIATAEEAIGGENLHNRLPESTGNADVARKVRDGFEGVYNRLTGQKDE